MNTNIVIADGLSSEKPEDQAWDKEDIYDSQISPLVKQIIEICQEHDLPLLVNVQFAESSHCTTCLSMERANPVYRWMNILARCHERDGWNIDKFMFAVMREARKTGHRSLILAQLGVPAIPEEDDE